MRDPEPTIFRTARQEAGLPLRDVYHRCQVSAHYLGEVERGRAIPGEKLAVCLRRELDIPDRAWDYYWWERGRFPPDLPHYEDRGHVEACLALFRRTLTS